MNDDFPCQQQQSNWSCLPFVVQSVLLYYGVDTDLNRVYTWCNAGQNGIPGACRWPESLDRSSQRFPDSDELVRGDWNAVEEALAFGDVVIVTIAEPRAEPVVGDHAVVILSLIDADNETGESSVRYCDPAIGEIAEMRLAKFLLEWDTAGGKAFVLRP